MKRPTPEEVLAYCDQRRLEGINNQVDPEAFVDFYESKGWKVGKDPMVSWQAAVRTWEKRQTVERKVPKNIIVTNPNL